VYQWKEKFESPAILKQNGVYYMFSSHLTGWRSNDNIVSFSRSLSGPWSPWKNFAPTRSNTFNSQTTYVLPINSSFAIYMGDRWVEGALSRSTYVWLPLRINGNEVAIQNQEFWDSPIVRPVELQGHREVSYAAKGQALSGGAKLLNNDIAGYIGGPGNGRIVINGIESRSYQRKTIKIYYQNGDKATRYASISINGSTPQKIAFLSTAGGKGISVVSAELKNGKNIVDISGFKNGWGPDILSLKVAT
jgi:hypothetical protein